MDLPCVDLEPFRPEDASTLAAWLSDAAMLQRTAPDWVPAIDVDGICRAYSDPGPGGHVLMALSHGIVVGHVGLRVSGRASGHLFHVIVDPALHGRGYGSALLEAVSRLAFDSMGLHRLQLFVFDDNPPAVACYIRAGYRIEGHHRDHILCGDRWLSTYSMALLAPEWREQVGASLR